MLKIHIFLIVLTNVVFCEEVFYIINTNNVLHKVSEKFLSISIDPAVLLAGANLSDISLLLARHLSPAYIRLAGPSTTFVKYIDNDDDPIIRKSVGANVIITPAMWFGINEWFNLANLTPVFGINDDETDKGVWDPKSTLPLLEMSDKFGVTCYWQLGYDCSNKTSIQYIEDLNILRQTLNGFPEHNDTWKIVGSDLSRCNFDKLDNRNFHNYVSDLDENIDAVMWESSLIPKSEMGFSKAAVWTSVPKDLKPVTFLSAMEWAKHVGEAAKMEYNVIFRLPRLLEMTHDTPVYWFSFIHKKLMGNNVLEVRPTSPSLDLLTYAHCTKRQNNFVRTGAITIMIINNGSESSNVNIRLGNFMLDKSMEVQSYILTSPDKSSTEVYLNDQKLTMEMLKKSENILKPTLRRAKILGYLSLEIPSQTIGFFILTGAKNALCSNNEQDLNSILAEINADQNQPLSEETHFTIEERWRNGQKADTSSIVGEKVTLDAIKKNILKEMELDKHYYNKMLKKQDSDGTNLLKQTSRDMDGRKETLHKHLKKFIEKAKKSDVSKDSGAKPQKEKATRVSNTFHFTIKEIEDILKSRAKAKAAAKNIKLSSSELDMLVDKATVWLPKHLISKRDINALLLEEKANFHQNNMFSQETYEQYAKQRKWSPKHKFRRSKPTYSRMRRNINQKLLNFKAKLEEHKKYMQARASHLRNSQKQKHKSLFSRTKRDINLDLLKKRTRPVSPHKIAVQPNLENYKGYFYGDDDDKDEEKFTTKTFLGETSDELLSEFLESEEDTIDNTKKYSKLFAESSYLDLLDFENHFKEPKSKQKTDWHDFFSKPKLNAASTRVSTPKKQNKFTGFDYDEYSQLLGSSNEFENYDDEIHQLCSHDWGFSNESPKYMKSSTLSDLWQLRSQQTGKNKKEKSAVTDLDDLIFPDDFEFGFLRKKRGTNSIAKEKLKILTNNIKSDVKKLREQIAEDKVKYIKEKLKNKMELSREKPIEKLKEKGFVKARTNIKFVPKTIKKEENDYVKNNDLRHVITLSANDTKNMNSTYSNNKVKRSLLNNNLNSIFGHYQPLTTSLRPWKPMNILSLQNPLGLQNQLALQNPLLAAFPLYTFLQTQALGNMLHPGYIGLRRKRFIDDDSINLVDNEILSDEDVQKDIEGMGKTQFLKYSQETVPRKNKLLLKTTHLETTNKFDSNDGATPIAIKAKSTQDDSIGKIVPGERMLELSRQDVDKHLKEHPLVNKTNNLEMTSKLNIDNSASKTIRKESTHTNSVVDKIIPGEMSYLERILGKKKVEPLENFAETVKKTFNNINKNVKDFFKSIF